MAVLGSNVKTILDMAKERGPDNKQADIIEMLAQSNEFLTDAVFKEGNLPTGELAVIRTGLPTTYWRLMNAGVPTSKATSAPVQFNCGMLSARSHVDIKLAKLNGDPKKYRISEAEAFLEAMSQEAASTAFYGSASSPEEFVGLSNTYNALSGSANSQNILSAGGSGSDNTSIWLVGWGERAIHMTYPKGSDGGLMHRDLGEDDVEDSDGYNYRAYKDLFEWDLGLVVKNWKFAVRIPNIDISDFAALATTQATTASTFIPKLMGRALARIPSRAGIRLGWYMNRTAASLLEQACAASSSYVLDVQKGQTQLGETIYTSGFRGVPIRMVDALLNTETVVS